MVRAGTKTSFVVSLTKSDYQNLWNGIGPLLKSAKVSQAYPLMPPSVVERQLLTVGDRGSNPRPDLIIWFIFNLFLIAG